VFVLLQLLLRQRKHLLADQRWHQHLDPFLSRTLLIRAIAIRQSVALPQWSRDALARPQFCLAITGLALVRRVA
jgi:hypothetical protein